MDMRLDRNVSTGEQVQMINDETSSDPGCRENTLFTYDETNQRNNGLQLYQKNDFTGVRGRDRKARSKWDSIKCPCVLFLLVVSTCANIGLVVAGVLLGLTISPSEIIFKITPGPTESASNYRRYRNDLSDYKNLVVMPCDTELWHYYPNMKMEKINTTISKEPTPDFCYLPNSERSNHFLKIFALTSAGKTQTLGVEPRHCIALNGRVNDVKNRTIIEWSERPKDDGNIEKEKSIYKVVRDVRTSELEISGPSGHYLVMASTIYTNPNLSSPWIAIPAKLEVLTTTTNRQLLSRTKSLWPSHFGFTSLSLHDVVYIHRGENIVFRMSNEEYLWRLTVGGHNAHLCCLPGLGGCGS